MNLAPVNVVSSVTRTASVSTTQNEQKIMRYIEIKGVQRVETQVVLYNKQGTLYSIEQKGTNLDYYG